MPPLMKMSIELSTSLFSDLKEPTPHWMVLNIHKPRLNPSAIVFLLLDITLHITDLGFLICKMILKKKKKTYLLWKSVMQIKWNNVFIALKVIHSRHLTNIVIYWKDRQGPLKLVYSLQVSSSHEVWRVLPYIHTISTYK